MSDAPLKEGWLTKHPVAHGTAPATSLLSKPFHVSSAPRRRFVRLFRSRLDYAHYERFRASLKVHVLYTRAY